MKPVELPNVTMVAITDSDIGETVTALLLSLAQVKPARTILFTTAHIDRPEFDVIQIPRLGSARAYNEFVTWKLGNYFKDDDPSHILLVQHDGYVLDGTVWDDEFLKYDWIGAPWRYTDGRNVGNGGFSLRSVTLHKVLAADPAIWIGSPEDEIICRLFRHYLEEKHGIKYAPESVAHKFSFEMHRPLQPTFGFHNKFWDPYREPVILSRPECALGDLIMLEPVIEWFHTHGYRVLLDVPKQLHMIFFKHYFTIEHLEYLKHPEEVRGYRKIDLTMAYEINPQQLVLKSYFEACSIPSDQYQLRNARLTPQIDQKLYNKYVVIHVNRTDMPYRNAPDIHWWPIAQFLEEEGYTVLDLGGTDLPDRYRIHAANLAMLSFIIGGADLFIGSDSGPSQMAVACGVKSVIMFGSVDPKMRYHDMSNIVPIQLFCQFAGCYHNTIGLRGTDCVIDLQRPPCARYTNNHVLLSIEKALL
jgi:hypothetical protein